MSEQPDTSPWRSPEVAPPTEADPLGAEEVWVTVRHAADVVDRSETWVRRQCRSGRVRSRSATGNESQDLLVPLARVLDLAEEDEEQDEENGS
jgi:hypothetical protein